MSFVRCEVGSHRRASRLTVQKFPSPPRKPPVCHSSISFCPPRRGLRQESRLSQPRAAPRRSRWSSSSGLRVMPAVSLFISKYENFARAQPWSPTARAHLGRELVARLLEAAQLVRPRVARAVEVEGLVVAPDPRPGDPAPLLLEVPEVHPGGDGQVSAGEVAGREARAPGKAVLLRVHVGEDGEPGRHLLEGEDEAHRVVAHRRGVHLDLREDRQVVEPRHVASDSLDVEEVAAPSCGSRG